MTPQECQNITIVKAAWDGLTLEHRQSTPGGADKPPLPVHFVTLSLGKVRDLWQQRDGRTRQHVQPYGEAVFMPAGCESRWKWRTPATVLALSVDPDLVRRTAADMGRSSFELTNSFGAADPRLLHLGLALKEEAQTGGAGDSLFAQCLSTAVAAHLLVHYSAAPFAVAVPSVRGLSAAQMQRVTDYIHDHLDASLNLAEIAAVAHVSPFHFARLFKQATGKTLHGFVLECRVDAAKRLLRRRDLSVGEIAAQAGFAQQSHLAAHFRRVTGLSPLAFRRRLGTAGLGAHESAQNAQETDRQAPSVRAIITA